MSSFEIVEPGQPRPKSFVHLHLHTTYSLLDGAQRVGQVKNPKKEYGVLNKAKELGMDAVAITDHGNMFGAVDFYKKARAADIKPILGCEVYMAPGHRTDREAKSMDGKRAFHLVLLAQNYVGYQNLCKMVTRGFFEGFYYNPRVDKELLREYSEGVIGLSACLASEISQHTMHTRYDEARDVAKEMQEILDGRFYMELQMNGIDEQLKINPLLVEIAEDLSIPLVATNDVHYMTREDAEAQDVLMAIQMRKTVDDPTRLKHEVTEFYLKSPEQMYAEFAQWPVACENTVKIASMCDVELPLDKNFFPVIAAPDPSIDNTTFLAIQSREGMDKRWELIQEQKDPETHETLRAEYDERLKYELGIIEQMGFSDYFLIVADFINWAKDRGIPVGPGRGSAAGSLVAFAIRITDVDPIEHDLLFERFLNPERVSMPDIDVDFCEHRREEVIEYVRERYAVDGGYAVSQIITFGTLQAKAAVRDVARAYGMSFGEADRISKLIPTVLGIKLDEAIQQEPRLANLIKQDTKVAKVIDISKRLEGLNRHASIHAAGVVISDGRPLDNHMPLYKGANGEVVSQYDMSGVESIGLIKFDFLGLKNLTLIQNCIELIKQNHGVDVDMARIPFDDPETFKLLCRGDTLGVFQLESSGMREVMMKLKPSVFEDVIALVALYRPGPLQGGVVDSFIDRKHGREAIKYIFNELEPILNQTYGVCIYQEQVMQIANVVANYSLGEADLLRRAMGKKKVDEMQRQRIRFLEGAKENEFDPKKAEELFDTLEQFAKYGFNKCLVGETQIMDARSGEVTTIKSLLDEPRDFVIHALGDDWQLHPREVTDVIPNGKKPVFKLTTATGKEITATGNHPFRTLDEWTLLEKLKPGDRIAAPRELRVDARGSWPEHELISLAGLISEGNTCHPSSLYFYNNSPQQIDDFVQAITQFPNTMAHIDLRDQGRMEVRVNTGAPQFGHRTQVFDGNAALELSAQVSEVPQRSGAFLWAEQLGILGQRATEKHVPRELFGLCDDDIRLFLGRLWSGDGYIAGKNKGYPPFYATASKQLAQDVQLLLLRLGMPSRLFTKSFKYRGKELPGYTVSLLGDGKWEAFLENIAPHCVGRDEQIAILREYHQQVASGRSSKDTLPAEIKFWVQEEREALGLTFRELEAQSGVSTKELYGKVKPHKKGFRRETIATLAAFFGSRRLQQISDSDVYWDTVVSIEPQGVQETYDLTVDVDHNFVANGLIVHNSHSAAYGLIAYQTGWLKANYRHEYMAALLTAVSGNSDKVLLYLNDCRNSGIDVLPPHVNESQKQFSVVNKKIRFGLAAVKGIGDAPIEGIIETRENDGNFETFVDFCERIDFKGRKINKKVLEALIRCGAFDEMGRSRAAMFNHLEKTVSHGIRVQEEKASAQFSLFGGGDGMFEVPAFEVPDLPEWGEKERLSQEKGVLGLYISGHPLNRYSADLDQFISATISELSDKPSGSTATIAGIVTSRKDMTTKRGDRMAFLVVEDLTGEVEVNLFPKVFHKAAPFLEREEPMLIKGDIEKGEKSVKFTAQEVFSLAEIRAERTKEIHVELAADVVTDKQIDHMQKIFRQHQGHCIAYLHVNIPGHSRSLWKLPDELKLDPSEALVESLERLFGTNPTSFK